MLKIALPEKYGDLFNKTVIPLKYTPRKLLVHPQNNLLIILERTHRLYSEGQQVQIWEEAIANHKKVLLAQNKDKELQQLQNYVLPSFQQIG